MVNKSVIACECGAWHLQVWDPLNPSETNKHIPWSCRSWRHEGPCRRWKGSQDFARVAEGMKRLRHWTYVVLTFAQKDWPDKWEQYRAGVVLWSRLRKRFVRKWGKINYIQTWERHKKGGCHVNVAIANSALYSATMEDFRKVKTKWLEPHATSVGFGVRTWIEPIEGTQGMAGYLTKLSRELTGAEGKEQIPEDAPPHFRRIRASQKTLPPPNKSNLTGKMRFCTLESWEQSSQSQRVQVVTDYYGEILTTPGQELAYSR